MGGARSDPLGAGLVMTEEVRLPFSRTIKNGAAAGSRTHHIIGLVIKSIETPGAPGYKAGDKIVGLDPIDSHGKSNMRRSGFDVPMEDIPALIHELTRLYVLK